MKTGTPAAMRELNRKTIYQEFFKKPLLSRADLCRLTKLKAPTVSAIIQELCDAGMLVSCGKGESNPNGGPLPILYRINTIGYCFAGLDICADGLTAVLLDENLDPCHHFHVSITGRELNSLLTEVFTALTKAANKKNAVIKTLGISVSGMVDHEGGHVSLSANPELNRFSFIPVVQELLNLIPYVDNDINILLTNALAQHADSSEGNSILCFGMRKSGVGMSIATDGHLYRGHHNISGNLQFIPGKQDITDILKRVLSSLPNKEQIPAGEELRHFITALQNQNQTVIEATQKALDDMCMCIASLQSVFDTKTIAICCELFDVCPQLFQYMQNKCSELFPPSYTETRFLMYPMTDLVFAESAAKCAFRHTFQL